MAGRPREAHWPLLPATWLQDHCLGRGSSQAPDHQGVYPPPATQAAVSLLKSQHSMQWLADLRSTQEQSTRVIGSDPQAEFKLLGHMISLMIHAGGAVVNINTQSGMEPGAVVSLTRTAPSEGHSESPVPQSVVVAEDVSSCGIQCSNAALSFCRRAWLLTASLLLDLA